MTDMKARVRGAGAPAQDLQRSDAKRTGRFLIGGEVVEVQKSGQRLAPAPADRAVDGEDADVKRALSPLCEWKVQRATRRGAFAGLGLGVVAFAVVGAVLGSALPGAGTVGGAIVGGLAGSFLVGGGIGNAAGKWQAGRMTLDSIAEDYAPRIEKLAKLARKAGGDAGRSPTGAGSGSPRC